MKRHVASDMKNLSLSLNAGYKLTDKLSVGEGIRAEAATWKFNAVLGPADVSFGRGYANGGGFNLGLHYRATDWLAFGLSYRSPSWFDDMSGGKLKASVLGVQPGDRFTLDVNFHDGKRHLRIVLLKRVA